MLLFTGLLAYRLLGWRLGERAGLLKGIPYRLLAQTALRSDKDQLLTLVAAEQCH
ncbi:hypothetical protein [Aeromonas veronii]|uniref:hypothetical protein n=1 Tax=Aeromonas veronii TaxID=654 RepID=UPI002245C6C3|nr:hypothetical protein [Aeromonas veronii]MCX0445106.1 hypothetical protein [Aeromonas veronii]